MSSITNYIEQDLDALDINFNSQHVESLIQLVELLSKWNKAYNLTAIKRQSDMITHHIMDSLAVLPFTTGQKMLDVGTGPGFPGLPLAIFKPDISFVLLDSNSKKTRFIQQAVMHLGLENVKIHHGRIEQYNPEQKPDRIISRAFTHLSNFIDLTNNHLADNGQWLAMKGSAAQEEIADLKGSYSIDSHHLTIPRLNKERVLVVIERGDND